MRYSGIIAPTTRRFFGSTASKSLPMKEGTPFKSLAIIKGQDPPVVKKRDDYPAWVGQLATPQPSLAALRRIPNEDAKDKEIMRFLKLSRRLRIRQRNEQSAN